MALYLEIEMGFVISDMVRSPITWNILGITPNCFSVKYGCETLLLVFIRVNIQFTLIFFSLFIQHCFIKTKKSHHRQSKEYI